MKPVLEIEDGTPEHAALMIVAEGLAITGRSLGDAGMDVRIVAQGTLSAAVYLFARECGKEAAAAWLRKAADQMEETFPSDRTVN